MSDKKTTMPDLSEKKMEIKVSEDDERNKKITKMINCLKTQAFTFEKQFLELFPANERMDSRALKLRSYIEKLSHAKWFNTKAERLAAAIKIFLNMAYFKPAEELLLTAAQKRQVKAVIQEKTQRNIAGSSGISKPQATIWRLPRTVLKKPAPVLVPKEEIDPWQMKRFNLNRFSPALARHDSGATTVLHHSPLEWKNSSGATTILVQSPRGVGAGIQQGPAVQVDEAQSQQPPRIPPELEGAEQISILDKFFQRLKA